MTPHIEAKKEDIAKIVLMPGDPLRAKYIADNFLEETRLVNTVRNIYAYTGKYQGKEITVMASGMGMASMGIYAYELYQFYDVDVIIRIGTCGTLDKELEVLDTILLEASYTESNYALMLNRDVNTHLAYADKNLNKLIEKTAKEENLAYKKGFGLCNEVFDVYLSDEQFQNMLENLPKDINFTATEMEAFALFYIANMLDKKAACLLTIVDSRYQPKKYVSSEERETKLDNMIQIALKTSLKL